MGSINFSAHIGRTKISKTQEVFTYNEVNTTIPNTQYFIDILERACNAVLKENTRAKDGR